MPAVVVLGPVGLAGPDGEITVLPGQQGDVLALLVNAYPGTVSVAAFGEALWRGRPSASARNSLRVVINRLRQKVQSLEAEIVTESPGYRLEVAAAEIDVLEFRRCLDAGRSLLLNGAGADALDVLEFGLRLWRGPVFGAGVAADRLQLDAMQLDNERADAEELLVEAMLGANRSESAAALATQLVDHEPLRERRWELLMLALYHCGRQAEALRTFQRAASMLRDELGIEPSSQLQALEAGMLSQSIEVPTTRRAIGSPARLPGRFDPPPVAANSFFGRETEVQEIASALDAGRLLTIIGPGGVGKTRLAGHFASLNASGGLLWCDLATQTTASIFRYFAGLVGVSTASPVTVEQVADALRDEHCMVVLDNGEHVIEPVARLAEALVQRCSSVRVLATSRVALGTESEARLLLGPLDESDAIDLLLDRGCAVGGDRVGVDRDIVALVQQVDRLPLAVELVAGQLRDQSPAELTRALTRSLDSLDAPRRSSARHRQLSEAIEWSLRLLPDATVSVFDQLGVMAGPFAAEAAERMIGRPVAAELRELAEHSLLSRVPAGAGVRYRLLETVRVHARSRLEHSGRLAEVRRRHALAFAAIAAELSAQLVSSDEERAAASVRANLDQFRAAFDHSVAERHVDAMVSLAFGLQFYFLERRHYHEAAWVFAVVDEPAAAERADFANLLARASYTAFYVGDFRRARELVDASKQRAGSLPIEAYRTKFRLEVASNQYKDAALTVSEWGDTAAAVGDAQHRFEALVATAIGATGVGAFDAGAAAARQLMGLAREQGAASWLAIAHFVRAQCRYSHIVASGDGAFEDVLEDCHEAVRLADSVRNQVVLWWGKDLSLAALRRMGMADDAKSLLRGALRQWKNKPTNTYMGLAHELKELEFHLFAEGKIDDLARLVVARRMLPIDTPMAAVDEAEIRRIEGELDLGDVEPLDDLVAFALELLEPE